MWSSSCKILRKQPFLKPRKRHTLPSSSSEWTHYSRHSSRNSSSGGTGGGGFKRWFMRRVYGAIVIVGVSAGGLLVVCVIASK